jgi:hypothetical protein
VSQKSSKKGVKKAAGKAAKKAGTKKAGTKKGGAKAAASAANAITPSSPFVTHTPIIITGESSAVEFERGPYTKVAPGSYHSSGLRLSAVSIAPTGGGAGEVCHTLGVGEVCLVVIECKEMGDDSPIRVVGGQQQSPAIVFDEGQFPEDTAAANRRKHKNVPRKIEGLKIFRVVNGIPEKDPFHTCQRVPSNGKCRIIINDDHVHPHGPHDADPFI